MDITTLAEKLGLTDDDFSAVLEIGTEPNSGPGTHFAATGGYTPVRGGGIGSDAYVAKITGTHPTYDLAREFVDKDENLSGSRGSGSVRFLYEGDGVYEYRRVSQSSSRGTGGFFLVNGGKIASLGNRRATIIKAIVALEAAEAAA